MSAKIKRVFRSLVLVFMLPLFAVPLSLVGNQIASAAIQISAASTPEDQAKSYWYYTAMKECFENRGSIANTVTGLATDSSTVETGKIFTAPQSRASDSIFGFFGLNLVDGIGDDGTATCIENGAQIAGKALAFWGITGPELYCGMGATRQNGQTCRDGDNNFVLPREFSDNFTSYIQRVVFGGKDPSALSAAGKYAFYSSTLIKACTAGGGLDVRPSDAAGNAVYALASGTNATGGTITKYYNATGDRTYNWSAYTEADGTKRTCKQLMDDANSNFSAFVSSQACRTNATIAASSSLLAACIAGASNVESLSYCADTYPDSIAGPIGSEGRASNSEARKACYAGQGRGAADECSREPFAYTGPTLIACINGSLNKSDTNYCYATYPESFTTGSAGGVDSNELNRAACKEGQGLSGFILNGSGIEALVDCDANPNAVGCPGAGGTSCVIEGVGWLICPAFNFLAGIADGAWKLIEGFLKTDIRLLDSDSGTYRAWEIMRNIANIGFVIVFLIIIFSQLSSIGISNYGVKKMLPRLVIAAILVNVSYFVSQIAVDLSNILGGSLKGVLDNMAVFPGQGDPFATGSFFTDITALVFGGQLAIAALAGLGAAAYFGGAALLIPIILAAVLALVVTILILVARQALVVLLVAVSPLAFLAMLLPNTENYFKQWRKIFISLLILYPAVAVLFGASKLASSILIQGGDGLNQLMAAAVMVLPLFAIPSLLKGSLNAVPVIGGLANKLATRANSNIGDSAKKRYGESRLAQFGQYRKGVREKRRALIQSGAFESAGRGPLSRMRNAASRRNKTINSMTGSFGSKQAAAGVFLAESQDADDVKAAAARVRSVNPDRQQMRDLAKGGSHGGIDGSTDHAARAAAIQSVVASNDMKGMQELWDESRTWTGPHADKLRSTLADSLQASSSRPAFFSQGAISNLRQGGTAHSASTTDLIEKAIHDDAYSAAKLAAGDKDELAAVAAVASSSTTLSIQDKQKLVDNAHAALTDSELSKTIGKNLGHVQDIRSNVPPRDPIT